MRAAGRAGYASLIGYARATFLVALTDAAGVGAGLAVMGVPLALPLASLVFFGAFIPLIGAVVAGFLAVVVALLAKGIGYALITVGLLIAVNQLEAHLLQPLVMGCRSRRRPVGRPDGRFLQQCGAGAAGRESVRRRGRRFFRSPHRGLKASFAAKQILGGQGAAAAAALTRLIARAAGIQLLSGCL